MPDQPGNETRLPDFPATFIQPVQWGDQDLFGHVNNTVYFRWIESARVAYWVDSGLRDMMEPQHLGPILAHTGCDYKSQIKFPDRVETGARVAKMGNASVTLEHYIYSYENTAVSAIGTSVVVLFNYKDQVTVPIAGTVREMFEKFEGRDL